MAIGIESSRLCTYRSAWEADQGRQNTYYASIAKALASDVAMKCTTDAVQVLNKILGLVLLLIFGPLLGLWWRWLQQ